MVSIRWYSGFLKGQSGGAGPSLLDDVFTPWTAAVRVSAGPSNQHLQPLVPTTLKGMVFGTGNLKCWGTWTLLESHSSRLPEKTSALLPGNSRFAPGLGDQTAQKLTLQLNN